MLSFDDGATSKNDDVLTEHGGLLHALFCCPCGPCDFSVSHSPLGNNLGFELGWTGLGLGLGGLGTGLGLTIDLFKIFL